MTTVPTEDRSDDRNGASGPLGMAWYGWLGIAASAALLWWALRDVSLAAMLDRLAETKIGWLFAAILFAALMYPLRAIRWRRALASSADLPTVEAYYGVTIGNLANNVLPARLGEIVAPWVVTRRTRIPMGTSTASAGLLRLLDAAATLLLALLAVAVGPARLGDDVGSVPMWLLVVGAGALLAGILVVLAALVARPERFRSWTVERLAPRLPTAVGSAVAGIVDGVVRGLSSLASVRSFVSVAALSILVWVSGGLAFGLAFRAFGLDVHWTAGFVVQAISTFAVLLPSTPGFFGLFEAATRVGLSVFGIEGATGGEVSLPLHLAVFFGPTVALGLVSMARTSLGLQDLRTTDHGSEPRNRGAGASLVPLGLAMGVGSLLRLWDLNGDSYTVDEAVEVRIGRSSVGEVLQAPDGFPPGFGLLNRVGFWLNDSLLVTRTVSAAFGIATIPVVWWIARRLVNGRAASWAAGLWAIWPLPIYFSREGRSYGLIVFCVAVALALLVRSLGTADRSRWLVFGAVAAVGMYTHYFYVFAAVAMFLIALWFSRAERTEWPRVIEAGLLFGALCVPLLFVVGPDLDTQVGLRTDRTPGLATLAYTYQSLVSGFTVGPSLRALHGLEVGSAIRSSLPFAIVGGPATCFLGWLGARHLPARWRWPVAAMLISAVGVYVVSELFGLGYHPRYVSWLTLPLVVLLAAGAASGLSVSAGRLRLPTALAVAALIGISLISFANRIVDDEYRNEDVRSIAAVLRTPDERETPVVSVADYMCQVVVLYEPTRGCYLPHDPPADGIPSKPVLGLPPTVDGKTLDAAVDTLADHVEPGERYLLVYARTFDGDDDALLLDRLVAVDGLSLVDSFIAADLYEGVRSG